MKASDVYTIDANIILRYLVRDVEEQYRKAAVILEAVQDDKISVFCEPVTLAEAVWVLGKVYGLSRQEICEGISPIVAAASFHVPDKPRYLCALNLFATSVSHFGDACACAAALEKCEGKLLSFDHELSNVPNITRIEELG